MIRRTLVLAVLGLLCTTRAAYAVNDTIANALQGVLGERRTQTLAPGGVGYYGYVLYPDRSYVAFCWEPSLEFQAAAGSFCQVEIRNPSDVVVSTSIDPSEPFPKSGEADSFTPTSQNAYFVRVFNILGFGTQTVSFILVETTLQSPWYFVNAASGYEAFVEIRNQSNIGNVSVTVRAYSPTGSLVGSTTVSLPTNGNTAVAVSSLNVPTGSGSVSITHNAMPGTIVANTTTLSGTTGLSFDSPFTPRMLWSTF